MDTETLLKVIHMIDCHISMNNSIIETDSTLYQEDVEAITNQSWGLESFRDHLQGYIEEQVSAVENQTEQ
jgi:hypothetical protein